MQEVDLWWDKDAWLFTDGDQDIMTYLVHTNKQYSGRYRLYRYSEFNSRPEDVLEESHKVFLLHFAGGSEKQRAVKRVADKLGRTTALLCQEQERQMKVTEGERRAKASMKKRAKKVLRSILSRN